MLVGIDNFSIVDVVILEVFPFIFKRFLFPVEKVCLVVFIGDVRVGKVEMKINQWRRFNFRGFCNN
jgi:hypothetical protein